jgi:hypothetical protein
VLAVSRKVWIINVIKKPEKLLPIKHSRNSTCGKVAATKYDTFASLK